MDLMQFSLNEWITVIVVIAQAGIIYYRLKKVEQRTERFNELIVEFAVQKNSLKHHRYEYEKQAARIENIIHKLDSRVSGIESHAFEVMLKSSHARRDK